MASRQGQKRKLLLLAKILLTQSDEDHVLRSMDLIGQLRNWGVEAERKSIYRDIEELKEVGLDVQCRKGPNGGWFIGQRQFQLPELKLLVDAVQSSRFLTQRKSSELIAKLETLTSVHQAKQLHRQVYVSGRIKTMNESIYYNVDKLHTAIAADRTITFCYFSYNANKERAFHRDGRRYRVSPCGLVWDSENYYLVAWSPRNGQFRHYRVDRMTEITITRSHRDPAHMADMNLYAQKHFGMFSGQEAQINLECSAELAGVILDRFGQEIMLLPAGEGRLTAVLHVVVSPQFWGWVFGLGPGVRITAPEWAAKEYRELLEKALTAMKTAAADADGQ